MSLTDVVTAVVVLVPSSYLVVRRVRKSARGCEHCRCGADTPEVPEVPVELRPRRDAKRS